MSPPPAIVYLLDDEIGIVNALTRLLRTEGWEVRGFTTPGAFLAAFRPEETNCLVLDVAMPGVGGLDFQRQLAHAGILVPIVFLTGRGDIPTSVRALRAGAVDVLTKPVDAAALIRAVRTALQRAADGRALIAETAVLGARLASLTPREREVLHHVVAGKPNKQIASELGTGEQNVKVHRGRVMAKMGVSSVADLVRAAEKLGRDSGPAFGRADVKP